MSRPLFSIHTTDSGAVSLYLEEQDAILDLVEDVVGQADLDLLDDLQGCVNESIKAEGHFENLDRARAEFGEMAIKVAHMTREEALDLAADIIRALKFHDIMVEKQNAYPDLKVVK